MQRPRLNNLALIAFFATSGISTHGLNAQEFAYVTNVSGNNVSVVNAATNTLSQLISVPGSPTGIAVSPGGDLVYVASQANNTVSIISAASRSVIAKVTVSASPTRLEVSPGGEELYVVMPSANQVAVVDVASRSVAGVIPVGTRPGAVRFSGDGTRAYVANLWSGDVSVIDTLSREVVHSFPAGSGPSAVAVSPDGSTIYVSNQFSGSVTVHGGAGELIYTISGFVFPNGVALTPDGARLFVSNGNGGTVSIVETATRTVLKNLPTGTLPTAVAVGPDGKFAYVTNQNSFTLTVIDAQNGTVVKNIEKVGVYPVGVALRPAPRTSTLPPPCSYTLSLASATFPAAGSSSMIEVRAPQGCPWSAASDANWVLIQGANNGSGDGAVKFEVGANAGIAARTATLTIAGRQVQISQLGVACSFVLASSAASLPAAGGSGTVTLAAPAGCSWNAVSTHAWLTIGEPSGNGPATLTYHVAPNSDLSSRTATLTVGEAVFTVTQSGVAFAPIRVNCGGPAFTDPEGKAWAADEQRNRSVTTAPISDTVIPLLYQTESWGDSLRYQFAVPNGSFTVSLRFAEIYLSQPGQRVFDILINGQTVAAGVDIAAAAGKNRAFDKEFTVNAAAGQIVIEVVAVTGTAKLSGIEIR